MCFSKFKLCFDYEQKVLPDKILGKWCEGRGEKLREFHNKTSELLNDSALHFTIKSLSNHVDSATAVCSLQCVGRSPVYSRKIKFHKFISFSLGI